MSTKTKKESKNFLFEIWKMAEEQIEDAKMSRAAKRLQRQAEIAVGDAQDNVDEAQRLYEDSVKESLNNSNFSKISDARLNLLKEKKKAEEVTETYKEVFKSSPKLS